MTEWNAREEAALALEAVLEQKGYSTIVLDRRIQAYPPSVDSRDKALVTRLVYGALSHRLTLDAVLDHYSRTPVRKMKPYVACTLRIALEQMLFEDRIPDRAAINEAVENVKHSRYKGLSGFVNGVLRAIVRDGKQIPLPEDPVERLSIKYSLPATMIRGWSAAYGQEMAEELCIRLSTEPRVCVRCNTLKTTPEALKKELIQKLGAEGVRDAGTLPELFYLERAEDLGNWPALVEGRMVVQNESAALAAALTLVKPGDQVLDLCAAPGGKSTMMAQRMLDQGRIISCDIYEHKIRLIQNQARTLGMTCIEACLHDGLEYEPSWEEAFDVVLLDAPCSGLGILRSKPEIRWNRSEKDEQELEELQYRLLQNAARYVRPGGRLVYSTCTLRAEENEWQMQRFLQEHSNFSEADVEKDLPSTAICDNIHNNYALMPEKGLPESGGWRVILPEAKGRDGFFIAACIKKS